MRCTNVALLLLSISLVAAIPIKENTIDKEIHLLPNKTEEIIEFSKPDLPIEEVVVIVKKPEESKENFTGPPKIDSSKIDHKSFSTLNTEKINMPNVIVVEDDLTDEEIEEFDEIRGRHLLSISDNIDELRSGVKPAPIPPNSPAGKAMEKVNSKKRIVDDFDKIPEEIAEDEIPEDEIPEDEIQEEEISSGSRRLLGRRRIRKAFKKVGRAVKKIFHRSKKPHPSVNTKQPEINKKVTAVAPSVTGIDGVRKHRDDRIKGLTGAAKSAMKANERKFETWLSTEVGKDAANFCMSLGLLNKPRVLNGCLEDMMITRDKRIAKEAAITAEEFLAKDQISTSKRFCTASGDPHFTNYDGSYFHLQEPGVYTLAKVDNFEVQEKMRKNGANRAGIPSCLTGLSVRLGKVHIEADVNNFGKVRINGEDTTLPRDYTISVAGLKVRYGTQVVEWKGMSSRRTGLKFMTKNGFGVMIEGGYCGVVEVNVPEKYFGRMQGICGNADGRRDSGDFKAPDGKPMNVRYGARSWEMSGYGGPSAPLSRWQLAWKPTGPDCKFNEGCEPDSPAVAAARAKEAERIRVAEEKERKAIEAERKARRDAEKALRRAERERKRAEMEKEKKEKLRKEAEAKRLEEEAKKAIEEARKKDDEAKRIIKQQKKKEREARKKEKKRIAEEARKRADEEARKAAEIVITSVSSDKNVDSDEKSIIISGESKKSKKNKKHKKFKKDKKTDKIIRILESDRSVSLEKLNRITKSIDKILEDAKKKEIEELKSAVDSVDLSKKDVNIIYEKYNKELKVIKSMVKKIRLLKKTIEIHFKQMKRDTSYLKKLKLVKPRFMKTLDIYNKQTSKIRKIILRHIIEGDDKDAMLGFLDEADKNTQTSTGKLSKAFLEHYEKYKNLLRNEKTVYESEMKQLSVMTNSYDSEINQINELKNQYDRAREVLNKLKNTYALSKQDIKDFNELARIIKVLFKNPKKIRQFLSGKVDGKCATSILKSHIANDLI